MANIEHKNITEANLHEPKGASTATTNETYVADGLGSGTFSEPEPKGALTATANQIYVSDGAASGTWTDADTIVGAAEYGGIGVTNEATGIAVASIGTTAQKVTAFNVDLPSSAVVPDSTTDNDLTVVTAGDYIVHFTASFSTAAAGDAGLYQFRLRINGVEVAGAANLGMWREMSGTSDTGSGGFLGIVTCAASDVMTLWVESDNGADTDDLLIHEMTLAVELLKAS